MISIHISATSIILQSIMLSKITSDEKKENKQFYHNIIYSIYIVSDLNILFATIRKDFDCPDFFLPRLHFYLLTSYYYARFFY